MAIRSGHDLLPSEQMFGEDRSDGSGLWQIGTAVNVVLSSQWALHQLLTKLGLAADVVAGHSSGEFLALAAAGAIPVDRDLESRLGALGLVFEDLERSGRVPAATLVAVAADRARVEAACAGLAIAIAIDNCPHQVVISGQSAEIEAAVALLRAGGILCEELPFHRAYHTAGFAQALDPIRSFFAGLPLQPPRVPIYSCATAKAMNGGVAEVRRLAVDQWVSTVEFRSTIEAMHADGVRLFIDVGARGNLAGFVEDTLRGKPHFSVAANLPRRTGLAQLNHLVASLYAQGVQIRPDHLYARRRPRENRSRSGSRGRETRPRARRRLSRR